MKMKKLKKKVTVTGFEPPTTWLESQHSNRSGKYPVETPRSVLHINNDF